MNLGRLKEELSLIVRDGSLVRYFKDWLNDALEEVAYEHDLPSLKRLEPYVLQVNSSSWLYDVPSSYHKKVFKVLNGNRDQVAILRYMTDLDALDETHTSEGDCVRYVCVENNKIGIYPKANDVLYLWFYEKPVFMEYDTDEPDCIPPAFRSRILISKVVIKNFKLLQDMMVDPPHNSLAWWKEEYREGLYGSPRGDTGMINLFVRDRKPKRCGGRQPLP